MSTTVTENEHDFCNDPLSVAVHVTDVVVATAKLLPETGMQPVLLMPELAVAITLYVTATDEVPPDAIVLMLLGHVMLGGMVF